ncbi:MAG: SRPBCC family protein [Polyangiaceae bacterium]
MATLHREQRLAARAERVWDGVRDIGALHTKLVPGFVLDTELDGDARIVHFANGQVLREPILSIDGARRRLAWSVESPNLTHYNAVLEVIPLGEQCKVVWTTDFLPHAAEAALAELQAQALAAMAEYFSC